MPESAKPDAGSTKEKRRKKGRQEVRRHWKMSLGRHVETYDRTGEHAHARPEKTGRSGADGDTFGAASSARRPRRRILIGAVLVALAAVVGYRVIISKAYLSDFEILAARKPVVVTIDCGPPRRIALASSRQRDGIVKQAVRAVLKAARADPDHLIVIVLAPAISFNSLRASDQQRLRNELGSRADHRYESAVAGFRERVVDAVDREHVTVLGLPVEPGEAGSDTARRTNRRYRRVINRLDLLASVHLFFRQDTMLSESRMVREAIPEALRRRGHRPVVFRQNVTWRVVVDLGEPGADQVTARSLVVAETRR